MSGPLQSQAQIEWKQEVASGQLWLAGSNLRMRDLVLRQINAQCSISNSDVYVNDFSATLNNTDYVNATGTFNLQPPHHYSGKASASVLNLAVFEPLLRAFGNQSQLAGSFKLDWEGSGQGMTASPASAKATAGRQPLAPWKNTGNLKLVLEKARYGNLQGLQANIDASYSPDGLDVPIIFFATSNMDFNAIARTKGDTLEIDKIQLNQVVARATAAGRPHPCACRRRRIATTHELRVRLRLNTVCVAKSRDKIRTDSVFRQSVGDNAV